MGRFKRAAAVFNPVAAVATAAPAIAKQAYNQATNPQAPAQAQTMVMPPSPFSANPSVAAATNAAINTAQEDERKAKGRAATMLTGGTGVSDAGLTISKRTLLGA
jgi:hypothetical protein